MAIYIAPTGNDSTGNGTIGNPYASLGKAVSVAQAGAAGWDIYGLTGTYSITSTTANANAGVVNITQAGASDASPNRIMAYTTTPGDGVGTIVLSASGISSTTLFSINAHRLFASGVEARGNGLSSIRGIYNGSYTCRLVRCIARTCTNRGFDFLGSGMLLLCLAAGCGDRSFQMGNGTRAYGCESVGVAGFGFVLNAGATVAKSVARGGTGGNGYGFYFNAGDGTTIWDCTAQGNAQSGFIFAGTSLHDSLAANCVSYGNGTYGFESTDARAAGALVNCAAGGNTSGNLNANMSASNSVIVLTADPFTNAAGGDLSLNTTAGGGALLRAAGIPGTFPGGTTTSYPDIGAVQSQGGGTGPTYARDALGDLIDPLAN